MVKYAKYVMLITVFIFLIMGITGCNNEAASFNTGKELLEVQVIDVGQGDAVLIRVGSQVTLVDTGDVSSRSKLITYLKQAGIKSIDNLIITHPHADHLGGVAAVLDNFTVKNIFDSGQVATSKLYREYLTSVKKKGIAFKVVSEGERLNIGGEGALKILSPAKPFITGSNSDLNNNSIVAQLVYGNFSMMLSADAEKEAEERIVKKYAAQLKSHILKSGHHGSNTASSAAYLKAVVPEAVLISVGESNDYHHPHPSVLKRYNKNNIKIYRTDKNGTITITSDGKTYNIKKEKN